MQPVKAISRQKNIKIDYFEPGFKSRLKNIDLRKYIAYLYLTFIKNDDYGEEIWNFRICRRRIEDD